MAMAAGTCLLNGSIVCILVVLDWDLCSHTTHGMHLPLVAGADDQLAVGPQEAHSHTHSVPVFVEIWHQHLLAATALLVCDTMS